MKFLELSLFVCISFFTFFATAEGNLFSDHKHGFSIEKPAKWKFDDKIHSAKTELVNGSETDSEKMTYIVGFVGPIPNSKKHSTCLVSTLSTKAGLTQAAEKLLDKKTNEDRAFEVIKSPVPINYGNVDLVYFEYSFLADKHNKDIRMTGSVWYFKIGSNSMRLICDVDSEFFEILKDDFIGVARSIKRL